MMTQFVIVHLPRDIASKIFVKYNKLERKLEKMKKDFE